MSWNWVPDSTDHSSFKGTSVDGALTSASSFLLGLGGVFEFWDAEFDMTGLFMVRLKYEKKSV